MQKSFSLLPLLPSLLLVFGCASSTSSPQGSGGSTSTQGGNATTPTGGNTVQTSGGSTAPGGTIGNTGGTATGGNFPTTTGGSVTGRTGGAGVSTGGSLSTGGASTGGAVVRTGGSATGGTTSPATGGSATGGTVVRTGGTATGGTIPTATGGTATGGSVVRTGGTATGGTTSPATGGTTATGNCGTLNPHPFGCKFAFGLAANMTGSLASYSYLQFATIWIETGIKADGTFSSCTGCNWLKTSVAPTNLIPVYYAYIIGFLGHANGYVDGNQCPASNPNCPNLTTGGGALVKSKRTQIVNAYAEYAKQSYAAWPTKPLVWLLEGDFIQYNDAGQTNPLSMSELLQLAADITCAIKSNMPNAVVAINHTVWNSDQETKEFLNGLKSVNYDMVWTTGVANNNGFIPAGTNASTYNAGTAKYSVIHQLSGKPILVDDGCGANTDEDWSKGPASVLNARIADGVVAFNHCVTQSSVYQNQIASIAPQATAVCH